MTAIDAMDERKRLPWPISKGEGSVSLIIIFMILALSGCMHHGNSESDDYKHVGSSYGHAGLKEDGHPHFSRSMRSALMLTDQQKEAFDRIETDYEKMVIRKTADIRAGEIDLAALLGKEDHDRQAIQEQVHSIGKMKEDLMMARIDSLLTLKALLTEGQYEKFREILHERMTPMMANSPHGHL